MSKNLQDLTTGLYNDFALGNLKPIVDAFADDVVFIQHGAAPYAGRVAGKAALVEAIGHARRLRTGETQTIEKILGKDDTVIVVGHEEYTVIATGKRAKGPFVHHLTFREGRISSFEDFEVAGADAWS